MRVERPVANFRLRKLKGGRRVRYPVSGLSFNSNQPDATKYPSNAYLYSPIRPF